MMHKLTLFPGASRDNDRRTGKNTELNLEDIHKTVQSNTWSPALFKDNIRNNDNFLQASLIGLDIDDGMNVDQAKHILDSMGLSYSITLSSSHQKDKRGTVCDRYRVIIPLNRPVTSLEFKGTWQYLSQFFPIDKQTKDLGRYFYASLSGSYALNTTGNSLEPQEYIEPKKEIVKNDTTESKSIFPKGLSFFLDNAHTGMDGEWNTALMVAAKEAARCGLHKNVALTLLESASPQAFDNKDMKAFESGWKRGETAGVYKKISKPGAKEVEEDIFNMLNRELEDHLHIIEDERGNRGVIVEEIGNNIVRNIDRERVAHIVGSLIKEHFGLFCNSTLAFTHASNYILYAPPLKQEPLSVTFKNDDSLSYHKLNFEPTEGDCPLFTEMMNRSTNKEALMAYIWSLFVLGSDRSQYIWLCGDGGDGKTSLQLLLERLLGNAFVSKNAAEVYNRFFAFGIIGKRLAVFPDTNSSTVIRSSIVKEITGGGKLSVEQKGKDAFTIDVDAKLIFMSNYDPDISSKNADLRRLIYCRLSPLPEDTILDVNYANKLWEEVPYILYKCKEIYEKLNINGGTIPHDEFYSEDLALDAEIPMESLFNESLDFDAESHVTAVELFDAIDHKLNRRKIKRQDFNAWLKRKYGVEYKGKKVNGRNIKVYTRIKLR